MVDNCAYYHGSISRNQSVNRLQKRQDGSFLLRKSPSKNDGSFVISVNHEGKVIHYSIECVKAESRPLYRINNGSIHHSPMAVVEHYISSKSGLKCSLIYPVLNLKIQEQNPALQNLKSPNYMDLTSDDMNNNSAMENLSIDRPNKRSSIWFHGSISRDEDTKRLMNLYRRIKQNGLFLIREKDAEKFVLSVVNGGSLHRYMIMRTDDDKLHIDGKEDSRFASLKELVEHHQKYSPAVTGIRCQLTKPCPVPAAVSFSTAAPGLPPRNCSVQSVAAELMRMTPKNLLDLNWSKNSKSRNNSSASPTTTESGDSAERFINKSEQVVLNRFQQSFKKKSLPNETLGFKSPYQNVGPDGHSELCLPREIYLPKENISIYEQLGSGHFGAVHLGRCLIRGEGIPCAVKFLSGEDLETNKAGIIIEAKIMQKLDHPHIVRMFGICETDDLKIIMELAPLGTLHKCLKQKPKFSQSQLLLLLKQVCDGMEYLSQQNVIHRDLAARNILLVSENFAKVSDFGMSRVLQESQNYYKSTNPGMWPLRWYAPECLLYYKFTSKSDVWSFGVTMWEVLSYGKKPYRNMTGHQVIEFLENDNRMEKPYNCSPELYDIMLKCWHYQSEYRPSFSEILPELTTIHEVSVLPPLILQ